MLSLVLALSLLAQDGGKPDVTVRRFAHAATCPVRCKTCVPAMARALDYLAKGMRADGMEAGNGGGVVVTSIAGLALMANGVHADKVEKAAQFVMRRVAEKSKVRTASGEELEGFGNWDLAFGGLFLAEYYAAKPSADLEKKLRLIAQKICEQRQENGGWGHAKDYAYGDLTVVTNACLAALGEMRMLRIAVPDDVIAKGVKYLESTSEGGVVGYSPRAQQRGWGHAGRASGAVYAMLKCGAASSPYYKRVSAFVKNNVKTVHLDHASPTLHYLMGGLTTYMLGADAWREYRANYLDLWLSAQQEDGSFVCPTQSDLEARGDRDMDGTVGPNYMTAVFALVHALPLERTCLTRTSLRPVKAKPEPAPKPEPTVAKGPSNAWVGLTVRESHRSFVVTGVEAGSPAAEAGLAANEVIVEFNGKAVADVKAMRVALNLVAAGETVAFTVLDGGERRVVSVTLVKRDGERGDGAF